MMCAWETGDVLFNFGKEPPFAEVTEDSDGEDKLAAADERKTKERRATDELRVVEEAKTGHHQIF